MTQAEIYIEELKTLVRNTDQESRERMDEIVNWFKIHNTSENMKLYDDFIMEGLDELEREVKEINKLIMEEKAKQNVDISRE